MKIEAGDLMRYLPSYDAGETCAEGHRPGQIYLVHVDGYYLHVYGRFDDHDVARGTLNLTEPDNGAS